MDIRERLREEGEIEVDLWEVIGVLIKSAWFIIAAGVLAAAIGFSLAQFVVPAYYESTTRIYILNKADNSSVTYSDVQMGASLTEDYVQLIKSRYVMEKVKELMSLDLHYEELLDKIDVDTPKNTRIVSITVRDHDPKTAMNIANCVREVSSAYIQDVMDLEAVNVAETANLPEVKAGPSTKDWTILGGVIGGLLMSVIVLVRYLADDTIKTEDDVEKYLGLSTLALIPLIETGNNDKSKKKKKKKKRTGNPKGGK